MKSGKSLPTQKLVNRKQSSPQLRINLAFRQKVRKTDGHVDKSLRRIIKHENPCKRCVCTVCKGFLYSVLFFKDKEMELISL